MSNVTKFTAIDIKRKPKGGFSFVSSSTMKIKESRTSSRRRMRVLAKRIRAEMERLYVGITFKRFEMTFTKHDARLSIEPTAEGLAIINEVQKAKEEQ